MKRIRVEWSGAPVTGPGLSTFYLPDAATSVAGLVTFFGAIANKFPPGITWSIPATVDVLDEATGILTGAASVTGGGQVASAGTDSRFAAGVGCRVVWSTAAVVGGRRLKGSTFLVPLEAYMYAADGTLDATNTSGIQSAVNTLVAGTALKIWHRPSPGGSDGVSKDVVAGLVPDKVSTLRSRRT